MKRIYIIILFAVLAVGTFAQDKDKEGVDIPSNIRMTFMGVPVNGNVKSFADSLLAKGFEYGVIDRNDDPPCVSHDADIKHLTDSLYTSQNGAGNLAFYMVGSVDSARAMVTLMYATDKKDIHALEFDVYPKMTELSSFEEANDKFNKLKHLLMKKYLQPIRDASYSSIYDIDKKNVLVFKPLDGAIFMQLEELKYSDGKSNYIVNLVYIDDEYFGEMFKPD